MFEDSFRAKGLRRALVETLIKKGITNKNVLKAISEIPRHFFLESAFFEHAYEDKAFPIDAGQTISQPYTVARQTELLDIAPGEKVLEIGTGSGYQTAILCKMGANVYSIEMHSELLEKAKKVLNHLGMRPVLRLGDGTMGWPDEARFDKILVTAAAPSIPNTLLIQLKPGGQMVIPVGSRQKQKMMKLVNQGNGQFTKSEHGDFVFVPLVGDQGW